MGLLQLYDFCMKNGKRKDIVKAIRLTWLSLESHLDSCAGDEYENECCNKAVGRPPFHVKTTKEYAFVIKVLTDCL